MGNSRHDSLYYRAREKMSGEDVKDALILVLCYVLNQDFVALVVSRVTF